MVLIIKLTLIFDKSYFISLRHIWRASNNATQRASADAGAFDGVFFTGRWWPFFVSVTQRPHLRGGGYEIHG
ncbi:hypothetical protein ET266_21720 [Escherichia coli]|nr:hypothetical protein [Escherichia coli]EEY5253376.1 hypothetical protein [Escherichia coli]MGA39691.1 hypothetical protein [Escherichia coli]HAJ3111099.1 hypothetical protein [Escherichia coli]